MKRTVQKSLPQKPASDTNKGRTTTRQAAGITRARIDPKRSWHYRVLLGLRDRLLAERSQRLRKAAEPIEPHSLSPADSASDEFDQEMALSELSADQDALFEVEEALHRIRDGSYGVCQETGRPIPEERLKAVPWTRFSRQVEARLEAEGAISRPRLGQLGSVRGTATGDLEESDKSKEEETLPAKEESLRVVRPSVELARRSRQRAGQKEKSRKRNPR